MDPEFATFRPTRPRFGDDLAADSVVEILGWDSGGTATVRDVETGRTFYVPADELESL